MWRRHAHDLPVPKGRARSGTPLFLVALLGVLMMQASRAQEAAPAGSGGADAGPIDTSITVQPSRATKPVQDINGPKTKSGPAAQLPGQQVPRTPGELMTPNAIGFPVAKRGVPQAGLQRDRSQVPPNPNFPVNTGFAGAGTRSDHPATMNRPVISGTGMTQLGAGPGIVRGAPKSLGTVSGTNLQPKR
jgi:hypothetical protein